ncbi:hypothetical protein QRX50_42650 [Amycolatopsis carbonis]|uniref:Uncharacterized protein n=1 Tax=Amycolatopsis carbonis TaxID=715471 RepID=A0A9Y2MWQ3_9PSEU|nr:hypothetical protein [Amycolatopsis sp. 2-15]WIX78027.1 hypothetical protein QRX50_42650 [Amycolatopsis sp. 2-15]
MVKVTDAAGAKGRSFDDLLPCFRRSETIESGDPALRGRTGPLRPRQASSANPVGGGLEAARQSGVPDDERHRRRP